ncbi:hypothetical protein [Gordoniibacillus kamchatkensis]|nr:hypothetical protein [Paenibacillus sp. VKM B-2647]
MKGGKPVLLTDEQMRLFITQGYLILKTVYGSSFTASLRIN